MKDEQSVICGRCGASEEAPVDWSASTGPAGRESLCPDCTRENLRSIEARLDETWW